MLLAMTRFTPQCIANAQASRPMAPTRKKPGYFDLKLVMMVQMGKMWEANAPRDMDKH